MQKVVGSNPISRSAEAPAPRGFRRLGSVFVARVGDEMVNPVSRERFIWRHTAESTNGEFAEFELVLDEGALVAMPHVHPQQREDFRVATGRLDTKIGGVERVLEAGATASVAPGVPHRWGNAAAGESRVVIRLTPALRSEDFFETFCGLARDGKVTRKGIPKSPLQFAVWAHAYRNEVQPASRVAQRIAGPIVAALARVGARRGIRARYPEYAASA